MRTRADADLQDRIGGQNSLEQVDARGDGGHVGHPRRVIDLRGSIEGLRAHQFADGSIGIVCRIA